MKNARRAAAAGHKTTQRRRRPPVRRRTALVYRRYRRCDNREMELKCSSEYRYTVYRTDLI